MDSLADLTKGLIGAALGYLIFSMFFGVLVQTPGFLVLSLVVASEYDPDKRAELDPSGLKSTVVGVAIWVLTLGAAYGVYKLTT